MVIIVGHISAKNVKTKNYLSNIEPTKPHMHKKILKYNFVRLTRYREIPI